MNKTFIIGYMFAGKSTYSQHLAGELHLPFFDLDGIIEQHCGKSITDIFAEDGEDFFRLRERESLISLCQNTPPSVISCGGGTPCYFDNLDLMKRHGQVIYLRTPLDIIVSRARQMRENRPLLSHISDHDLEGFIANQLHEREYYYLQADLIYDSQHITLIQK